MNIEAFNNQIRSVKQRIKNLSVEKSSKYVYSAFFIKNGRSDCMLNRVSVESFPLIRKNLLMELPDKVRVELYESEKGKKILYQQTIDLRDKDVVDELSDNKSFQGLGEAEVNEIVQSKISEFQKLAEFKSMKTQIIEYEKKIVELENSLAKSVEIIEDLEKKNELKSGIKYYAGVIGDLLEGFGISKDKIRKPMAALMGFDEEQEIKNPKSLADKSGIVEDDEVTDEATIRLEKRKEIIDLISQYLHNVPDDILSQIFSIFSEIEGNTHIASELLNHAKSLNSK